MATDRWSDVFSWPMIGVHAVLTPDGKVLTFGTGSDGQQGGLHIFDVWDPLTGTHQTLEHTVHTDIFCSAAAIVPETGEILVSGGDTRPFAAVNNGVADVNVFDYRDMTLSPSPTGDMTYARWYPSALTLANGKTLLIGGKDGALPVHLGDSYFGGSQYVHFGATAATGGASNLHRVRFASVDAVFEGDDLTEPGHMHVADTTVLENAWF